MYGKFLMETTSQEGRSTECLWLPHTPQATEPNNVSVFITLALLKMESFVGS